MKKKKLETQYNTSAKNYHQFHVGENRKSTEIFFEIISKYIKPTKGKWRRTLLDLGCGSGSDFKHYLEQGFVCYGVDSSKKMLAMVEKSFPEIPTRRSDFSKPFSIPFRNFTDEGFSLVVSKWAMQTAKEIQPVYENVYRVLVSSGHFIFLVVHPLRQFLEKKKSGKDYFKQEIVASEIFDKQITVYEPTHTLQEYLSPDFLKHFELIELVEDYEFPAAEQIGGDIYPTYLIVVARKK